MAKITIFQDSIYFGSLINQTLSKKIEEVLSREINTNEGASISNKGGYQTNEIQDIEIGQPLLEKSSQLILSNYNLSNKKFGLTNLWINKNSKNNFNIIHNHPMSDFSGVYYHQVPENSGELIFFRGDRTNQMMAIQQSINDKDFCACYEIQPLKNQIIVFPSHLLHMVNPNRSDEARISVSFNIKLMHG